MGVVKTNTSVFPERRDDGWCARLETRMESVKVLGLIDIEVVAAGSIFAGTIYEPIKDTRNPQAKLMSGIPFTRKPKAIQFDYKVKLAPEKDRVRSTGFSRKTRVEGQAARRGSRGKTPSLSSSSCKNGGKMKRGIFIRNGLAQWYIAFETGRHNGTSLYRLQQRLGE